MWRVNENLRRPIWAVLAPKRGCAHATDNVSDYLCVCVFEAAPIVFVWKRAYIDFFAWVSRSDWPCAFVRCMYIVDTYKADGKQARTYFLGSALSLNLPIHQRPLQINNKLLSRKTRCVVNISFEHSSKAIVSSLAIFQFQRPVYYLATYIYLYNEFARRLCDSRILNTNIFVTSTQAGIGNVMIFVCWRFF